MFAWAELDKSIATANPMSHARGQHRSMQMATGQVHNTTIFGGAGLGLHDVPAFGILQLMPEPVSQWRGHSQASRGEAAGSARGG